MLSAVPLAGGALTHVHVPDDLTGQVGGQVIVPVKIDNAAGVRGAEIHLNYDRSVLGADEARVLAGSVWSQAGTQVVANVDDDAGSIVVFVFAAEGLSPGSGSLLEIEFSVRAGVAGGSTAVDLAKLRLNEGAILLDPEPAAGADPTDGRITLVSPGQTASISGSVFADTNSNNQPDPHEGVPGVKIVLVSADGSQQAETLTGEDGRYEFGALGPGCYRIVEQQPAAYVDGGPNEIPVDLAEGEELADQNFRERGLRPEYVYSRLFTTSVQPVGSTEWASAVAQIGDDAGSIDVETQTVSMASMGSIASAAPMGSVAAIASLAPMTSAASMASASSVFSTASTSSTASIAAASGLTEAPAPVETEIDNQRNAADDLQLLAANCVETLSSPSRRHQSIDLVLETSPQWMLEC